MKNFHVSRRVFVKRCATVAAMTGLPLWFVERRLVAAAEPAKKKPSPNDRPGVALIGCGGQGTGDAKNAANWGDIVAVCDVDSKHAEATAAKLTVEGKPAPKIYSDFRRVLERADIHALVNGTPDHWHTLVNLGASRAKKDVYAEKPLTLTIDEGRRLVREVKQSGIVLQTGTQQRSSPRFRLACELVRNERIGKLREASVWLPAGLRDGPFAASAVPAELNWDFWLGQAPKVDYVKQRCHQTFRFWYDYSGGTMTDWGAHHNDIALWGIGAERSGPVSVEAKPGVEMIPGGFSAFSEYAVDYTYANGVTHSCHSTAANAWNGAVIDPKGQQHGVKFEGADGWIWVTRGKIEASDPEFLTTPLPSNATRLYESNDHMGNFFDSIRSRKPPICEAEIGHRSASVCHLGVISLRLGRKLQWDPQAERFVGDDEANRWLTRELRKPWSYDSV